MKVNIRILHTDGCADTPPTIEMVKKTASEMGFDIDLETIKVEDQKQAENLKFLGSPTVQVNGLDIELSVCSLTSFDFM